MDTLKCIMTRRSIRKYTEQPVEFDKLATIVEAGIHAPSAGNMQNWRFVIVTEKSIIKSLYEHCLKQEVVYNAQAVIAVCGVIDKAERLYGLRGKRLYTVQNCACAIQNMLLTAHELGLGTCWIGAFDEDKISSVLNIPGNARPQALITVGYPDENPKIDRKDLSSVLYFNSYGLKIKDVHILLRDFSIEVEKYIKKADAVREKAEKSLYERMKNVWEKLKKNPKVKGLFDKKKKE